MSQSDSRWNTVVILIAIAIEGLFWRLAWLGVIVCVLYFNVIGSGKNDQHMGDEPRTNLGRSADVHSTVRVDSR